MLEWAQSGDLAQLIKLRAEQGRPFSQEEVWLLFGQVGRSHISVELEAIFLHSFELEYRQPRDPHRSLSIVPAMRSCMLV